MLLGSTNRKYCTGKRVELGHMLLGSTNRKYYTRRTVAPSYLILVLYDLNLSNSSYWSYLILHITIIFNKSSVCMQHYNFVWILVLHWEVELQCTLPLNIKKKSFPRRQRTQLDLVLSDRQRSNSMWQIFDASYLAKKHLDPIVLLNTKNNSYMAT